MTTNRKQTLLFFIIAVAIGAAIFFSTRKNNALSPTQPAGQTSNWKTYTNNFYHVEFKYPKNYSFNENSDKIEINAPLSICNPALVFNTEEYKQLREVQIIIKKRHGSLEKILADEGGKNYGWESDSFNEKPGFSIAVGAEMITPYTRFLVEGYPGEVLDIQSYIFASGDQGSCVPRLDIASASDMSKQILSTFKFLDTSKNTISIKLYYNDPKLDPNMEFCEARDYIEKVIPKTDSPVKDAMNTLIRSDIFKRDDKFILKSINLKQDGTLILEFPFIGGFTTGGSCRIGILTSQIKNTAMQFSEVKKVIFEPDVFQP